MSPGWGMTLGIGSRAAIGLAMAVSCASAAVANDWSGFYAGAGVSFRDTGVAFPDGANFVRIDDVDTGVVDFERSPTLDFSGNSIGGHVLAGYMFQAGRFVFGLEGDYEFGNGFSRERTPGIPACVNPTFITSGNFPCIGTNVFFSEVQTMGHIRGVAGVELTPSILGFVAGGIAFGRSPDLVGATAGGFIAASPSAPLLGVATVTRSGLQENIHGYSIGGGLQFRAGKRLRVRAEYLYDRYKTVDIAVGGAGFGGTISDITSNSFVSPGREIDIDSHTIRLSAIYQFNRSESDEPEEVPDSDWAGLYVGGGLSMNRTEVDFPNAINRVSIDDSGTPGLDFQRSPSFARELDSVGGHVLGGYMFQKNRLIFGLEGDYEFGNSVAADASPGVPECFNPAIVTPGNFACIGQEVFFSEVKTKGHLRGIIGVELTPRIMAFASGGLAMGRSPDRIGARSGGLVAQSPSSPLVGAATVTRSGIGEAIHGYSLGGGFQIKATRHLRFRAEYLYDRYDSVKIAVGGAGFGGTIGDVTTNAFVSPGDQVDISNQTVRFSAIWQF